MVKKTTAAFATTVISTSTYALAYMDIIVLTWYQSSGSQQVSLTLQVKTIISIIPGKMDSNYRIWMVKVGFGTLHPDGKSTINVRCNNMKYIFNNYIFMI
jgi:hypothetical protein